MRSGKQSGDRDELRLLHERVGELERENVQLRTSEDRLQILFEHAPDAYYLSDLKGTFVDGNTAAERVTGYKKGELIGKSFLTLKLLAPGDLLRASSLLAKNLLGHPTGPDEFTLTRKDGTPALVEIHTHPVRIGDRRLALGIARDISARKQTERQLRERVKELRALYSLAEIIERDGITLGEVYQELTNALPESWQYPEITCARIRVGDSEFRTGNFADSPQKQSAPVRVAGVAVGSIDVGYLDERPEADEGPFLKEERRLIDALAERLGRVIERKNAEEGVRESEKRLSLVLGAAKEGIYDVDLRTGLTFTSPEYAAMLGYDPTEILLSPESGVWESLLHPDDRESAVRTVNGCRAGETDSFDMELRLRTKAGDWRWVRSCGQVVERDLQGNALRLVGTHTDIDSRKRADEILRVKDWAIESAINGMAISDLAGSLSYVNPAFVRLWGYGSPAEILGRSVVEFWRMGDKAEEVAETVRSKGGWRGDLVAQRKDGVLFDVHVSSNLVLDAAGRPICMQASFEDITMRKRADEALRESEDRYRRLVDNIPEIVFTIDLQGKLTFVSRQAKEILGYESAEAINMSVLAFIPEEEHQRVTEGIRRGMAGEKLQYLQVPMTKKSGERVLFECSFTRVYQAGRVIGAQGTAVDITERKRAEDARALNSQRVQALLQLNQMAAATLQEITDFALEEAVRLTQSKIGYLAFLNEDESVLTMHSWSKSAMAECAIAEKPIVYPVLSTGLWGEAVRQRRPVITNDYAAADPRKKGYPQGHVALTRHMNTPVFDDSRIVIVAGVGNKTEEYDQGDVQQLSLLMGGMWRLIERKRAEEALSRSFEATLTVLGHAVEMRDPYTAGHQQRVTGLAIAIARKLECTDDECNTLRVAGMLHDIGKLGIPAEILSKPGALSPIEFELVHTHPQAAYEILARAAFPGPVAEIALQHHERPDGSGYPRRISGGDILLEARILAVADVIEAMASHRPYRPALGIAAALDEIRAGRGTRYDQQVVDACAALFESGEFSFQPASAG